MSVQLRAPNGWSVLVELPKEYDARIKMTPHPRGGVIVVHPEQPPIRVTPTGKIEKIVLTAESGMKQKLENDCG